MLAGACHNWAGSAQPAVPATTAALPLPTLTPGQHPGPLAAPLIASPTATVPVSATLWLAQTRTPTPTATRTATSEPVFDIGHSVAGRPLTVWRFGSGRSTRLIVAGIHGGYEGNTIALADALITHLDVHPDVVPLGLTLYILRSLNPDGEARGQGVDARANENGVDLNRNWPSHWRAGGPRPRCWNILPLSAGERAGSEPETQALMRFMLDVDIEAVISYHSAALGIFPGGQPPTRRSLRLAEALAAVSAYPYPPIDTGCQYTGQLIDWAADRGIAAVDIELTNHRDADFEENLNILEALLAWQR